MGRHRTHDLDNLALFAAASPAQRDAARTLLTSLTVPEGVVLWRAGQVGHAVVIIAGGSIGVSCPDGQPVAVVGPGEVVGELALLGGRWRAATVTTLSQTVLYVAGVREFDRLLEVVPLLRERMVETAFAGLGTWTQC